MAFSSPGNVENNLGLQVIHTEKQMMRSDISRKKRSEDLYQCVSFTVFLFLIFSVLDFFKL